MKKIILLFHLLILSCGSTSNLKKCSIKPIKYLTMFTGSRMWKVSGGDSPIDLKTAKELNAIIGSPQGNNTFFLVPIIIQQIGKFYDDSLIDEIEKEVLIELSIALSNIFEDKNLKITKDSPTDICQKVNLMIDAYHKASEDDNIFPKLIITMDDGPFLGIKTSIEYPPKDTVFLDDLNCKLILRSNNEGENTLELEEKNGKLKWKIILARSEEYHIESVTFIENAVLIKNELGYKIGLYGDGEFIHLYLGKEGNFRHFFHSW